MHLLSWAILSSFSGYGDYIPYVSGACNLRICLCKISPQSYSLGINTYTRSDLNKEWFVHSVLTFDYTPINCEPMQMYIVWVSDYVSKAALLHAGESLGAGVIDRTILTEDWTRKEFNIQFSSVQGERSQGLVLFFLIAPSLTHMANEHIQSMARPSGTRETAFTTRV